MARKYEITRPDRWDNPFGGQISDTEVHAILQLPVFQGIDAGAFPGNLTLVDIIRNDTRILAFQPGEVILRRGDYGNSLFVVLSGSVRMTEDPVEEYFAGAQEKKSAGSKRIRRKRYLRAFRALWHNSRVPERRKPHALGGRLGGQGDGGPRARLDDTAQIIETSQTTALGENQMFGVAAALSRAPHSATAFAETSIRLLELRWQGLRDLRQWDDGFRDRLDRIYRAEGLMGHLRECPLFRDLDEATLEAVARGTTFESHGENEWAHDYKRISSRDVNDVIGSEPVIVDQDGYIDEILVMRMGFGRITERLDRGHRTVGFLSQNEVFGLAEVIDHANDLGELRYRNGLRAVGYVDVLRIPTAIVEEHLLPIIDPGAASQRRRRRRRDAGEAEGLEESMLNFLVSTRTINGTQVMAIDTERCTGCDDCVRACATAHDNNPRFVRQGPEHANIMIASACMHCVDPVCLIGCPTGAIHRTAEGGLVVIDDEACIGCTICANSCPYDNIRMVEVRNASGGLVVDEATHAPILKATKCDLCASLPGGPACVRACPHDALIRIDACDRDSLAEWIQR